MLETETGDVGGSFSAKRLALVLFGAADAGTTNAAKDQRQFTIFLGHKQLESTGIRDEIHNARKASGALKGR